MKARTAWIAATFAMAGAVVTTALIPGIQRGRALEAARAAGLPVTEADLNRPAPPSEDATPLLDKATEEWSSDWYAQDIKTMSVNSGIIVGTAGPYDRPIAVAWLSRVKPSLGLWRAASRRPKVAFGRRALERDLLWEDGVYKERYAGQSLALAAALGYDPKENLLAAARLAGLMRQELGFASALRSALLGEECLRVARRLGMVREVDRALGSPPSFREALRLGLASELARFRESDGTAAPKREGLLDQLKKLNPFATDLRTQTVNGWVAIWRELPEDPNDFEGAAKTVERRLPDLYNLLTRYAKGSYLSTNEPREVAEGLRRMGRVAAFRAQVLKEKP